MPLHRQGPGMIHHAYGLPVRPGTPRQYLRGDMGALWLGACEVHAVTVLPDPLPPCPVVRRLLGPCGWTVGVRLPGRPGVRCPKCGHLREASSPTKPPIWPPASRQPGQNGAGVVWGTSANSEAP